MRSILLILGFLILVLANVAAWSEVLSTSVFQVSFFNVGQGDAIFLQTPQGHQILIDGGPDDTVLARLAKNMLPWDREIDLVILTHPEQDHISGLIDVLELYEVKHVLWTGVLKDTGEFASWMQALENEGAEITIALAPQLISWGSDNFIEVLYPKEDYSGKEVGNVNDTSVVTRLELQDYSFLFTGDISEKVERELVESKVDLAADVLKVAHHGSKTSSSALFLEEIRPSVAVIQVGENTYSHPHPLTLAMLAQYGIEVMRTDEEGDILFLIPN